jgi:hypothetical protein
MQSYGAFKIKLRAEEVVNGEVKMIKMVLNTAFKAT